MVVIEQELDPQEIEIESKEEDKAAASKSRSEDGGREASGAEPTSEEGTGGGSEDESFEDALTQDELNERTLNQANDLKLEGNKLFGAGQYEDALLKYELALQIVSEIPSSEEIRAMCHGNRGACFLKLGKYEDSIKECTKALELKSAYAKALLRRAEAYEKLDNLEEAIADMKKVIELDPSNDQARRTIRRLEPLAAEKREKMKEEMIGKLKDMGNSILGRFGMSVDNFKAVKDPSTGSYSVQFQR